MFNVQHFERKMLESHVKIECGIDKHEKILNPPQKNRSTTIKCFCVGLYEH